jgi:predicted Zn-dependent peptidase
MALPEVGTTVGRYTVLDKLGEGAMGAVFLASDPELDRRVALKLLVTHGAHDLRLLDEARALARLQHPNVVAVHDVGRWEGQVYLAMEHVAGMSLDRWLEKHAGWRERVGAFVQAAHGLAAAHRANIVHHDVKPSNVMVGDDGRVRLVDFGIARSTTPDLAHGSVAGTPRYMSPEQRRGDVADARTDQYSLCIALYEAMWGVHPFPDEDETVPRMPPANHVPPAVRDAILKGLSYDVARRHPNMEALIAALTPKQSNKRIWITAAALVVVAGGTAAFAMREPAGKYDAILEASNLPSVQLEPLPDDPLGVTVHRLSNGLTVYISTDHDRPRVRATMRFHAGAADAPGIATLAMMMSRRGTERIGTTDWAKEKPILDRIAKLYEKRATAKDTTQIDAEIDAATAEAAQYEIPDEHTRVMMDLGSSANNAWGFRDQTRFEQEFASNRFDTWAELEADRWMNSQPRMFRAGVAEALQWDQKQAGEFNERLLEMMYPKMQPDHPVGFGAGVVRENMAREPYTEVVKFFRERYVPNNADLVLVGDIDPITAIPILERAFGAWQPRQLPPRQAPQARDIVPETITLATGGNREISYHWSLPPSFEEDPAFSVIDQMVKRMIGEVNPSARIHVYNAWGVSNGASTTVDDAAKQLDGILDQLKNNTFSDEHLAYAKKRIAVNRAFATKDLASRSSVIVANHNRFTRQVWRNEVARITATANVTREDVARLAKKMLDRPKITVRAEPGTVANEPLVLPKLVEVTYPKGPSAWSKELLDRDVLEVQPKYLVAGVDYDERDTPAGHLIVKTDRKAKFFSLTFRYDVGTGELPMACEALYAAMGSEVIRQGARLTALQTNNVCNASYASVTMSGLAEDLKAVVGMVDRSFVAPTEPEWQDMLRQVRGRITQAKGRTDWIQGVVDALAMYGKNAPMLARYDMPFIDATPFADGARDMERLRNSKRSIGYYGPHTIDEVAALLPPLQVVDVPQKRNGLVRGGPKVFLVDAGASTSTTNVSVLFGVDDLSETLPATRVRLLDQYWSIDSHPLHDKLGRPAQFSLMAMFAAARRDAGHVALRFKSVPEKVPALLATMLAEILEAPIDTERFARAKAEGLDRMNSEWIPRADVPVRMLSVFANGQTEDPRREFHALFNKQGLTDLEAIIADLRKAPRAITIWGNVEKIDRAELAKHGEVVELTVEQLLSIYEPAKAEAPKPAAPASKKKPAKKKRKKRR